MRKILLLITVLFLGRTAAHAQPQAYESKIDYQKTQQAVAAIDLPYNTDLVEDALKDYMAAKGHKGASLKGFTVYRGVRLDDTDTAVNDLHFKIDRRNRDKNASTVSLLVAMPSEDPSTRAAGVSMPLDKAKLFLNGLVPSIEARHLETQITAEQELNQKSQKKYNGLQSDQADLEKKIRNANADLDQNKKDQIQATADLQANMNGDSDSKKKAQKKLNKLLDQQASLEKKIRNWQTDLDQNKNDQATRQADLQQQQQMLDSMKARRKS